MTKGIRVLLLVALLLGPPLEAIAQGRAQALPSAVRTTAAQEAWIERHVTEQQRGELRAIARSVAHDGAFTPSTERRWQRVVGQLRREQTPTDVSALVQWVLRESYVENVGSLQDRAEKVEHLNAQKAKVREELAQLRGQQMATAPRPELRRAPPSAGALRPDPPRIQDGADARIAALDAQLETLNEDSQLANVELQNWVQKQQEMLQMLTSLSDTLHDSAMATVRNLGE